MTQISLIEQQTFSLPMSFDVLKHLSEDETVIFIAAVSSESVLGYASLKCVDYEGFFNNIAVNSSFRGKGIGDILVKELLSISKDKGITEVSLEVRETNDVAINLYKKNGFELAGIIKNYYTKPKENAIIMRKIFENGNIM